LNTNTVAHQQRGGDACKNELSPLIFVATALRDDARFGSRVDGALASAF